MSAVTKIRAIGLRTILALVLALLGCAAMWGQQDDSETGSARRNRSVPDHALQPDPALQEESSGEPETESDALPAERIIEILNQRPELLDRVKAAALQRMQDEGRAAPETEVTDDALFNRIEQDASLRALLTRQLREKGFLTQSDLESLGGSKPEPASPERARRKTPAKAAGKEAEPAGDQNQPPTTARPSPYPGLPALQDLYRQIPSQKGTLQRFGGDIFQTGTGNLESLPMDLPAGSDYILGPGDGLNITTWGSVSQRLTRTVDRQGKVSLPEAGDVVVAGQSVADAQRIIEKALRVQFRDINADLSLTRLRSIRVYVVGDVLRPGA